MNIEGCGQEVGVVKTNGLPVGAPEEVPLSFLFPVEIHGVPGKKIPHGIIKVFFCGADEEMNVIGHETKSIEVQGVFAGDLLHQPNH
jgi:hypothetical protein